MAHQSNNFRVRALSASIALINAGLVSSALAQEPEPILEEVVVSGIRGSLTNAMDIKRDSYGVVDAISAEDIGKFPDTNLAESLQRITGVSIDRSNNEGNQVTVRGMGPSFNLVTLNNRQMPNSSALQSDGVSRSFNFREIAAESVAGVEVYKTGKAHIASGGIGAAINIKTAKPFDNDGLTTAFSVNGVMDTSVEEGDDITPEISGMISQNFLDGKLGVLLSLSHAERDSRKDRVGTSPGGGSSWVRNRPADGAVDLSAINTAQNPTQTTFTPWTVDVDVWDYERERQNGQLVLQFAPTDTITGTIDYTASRIEETVEMNRQSFWFDSPVGAADSDGTLVNPRNPGDELNFWAWDFFFETENESVGLNLEWLATETLSFNVDYHDSTSESQPDGQTSETLANLRNPLGSVDLIGANFGGDIPEVIVNDSSLPGGAYNPDNIVSDLFQKRGYQMENNIKQFQINGKWENADGGALAAINFGVHHTNYQIDTFLTETFALVDVDISGLPLEFETIGDTADEFSGTNQLFPLIPRYRVEDFLDIVRDDGQFFVNPPTINGVEEETLAGYVSFDFEDDFNGMPVRINVGVRYESTDVTSYSVQEGLVALNFFNSEGLSRVFDGVPAAQELEGDYTRLLPNVDFSIDVTEQLVGRFSYSTTISRADISAMFPSTNVRARPEGPSNASQGNPNLLPIESDNIDASVEWYYDEGSYVSLGYFKKFVENFIGADISTGPINNVNGVPLTDPSVNPRPGCPEPTGTVAACLGNANDPVIEFDISSPGNIDDAKIDGWEFNVQHMFGDSGFGAIFNYTLVDSDAEFDTRELDRVFALTGLSDSANLIGFYENYGFQVRLAYNWRDDFLLALGNEPLFTEEYGQWDISASYDINDNFSVFFDGLNLTNETTRRHGRFSSQLVDAEQFGARYNFGVRVKF